MDLTLYMLLYIHVIQTTHNLAHSVKIVNGFPEFAECQIFDKFLTFLEIKVEGFNLNLEDFVFVRFFIL